MADKKPAGRRQRRNREPTALALPARRIPTPTPPAGLSAAVGRAWVTFWASDIARVVEPTDLPALERLHRLYTEHEVLWKAYRKDRLVVGSTGQPVLNPLTKMLAQIAAEIRVLEAAFGLTPAARVRLGLNFAEATKTLRELAQVSEEAVDVEDPR